MASSPMRLAREKRNISIEDLADKVGVSTVQIWRIENSGIKAVKTAAKIVKQLGGSVTLDEVCRPEEYMEPEGDSPEAA